MSHRAQVEMFAVCFFVTLHHGGLAGQATAAMENPHGLVIIRPYIMTLLFVTRSPQSSKDSRMMEQ